MDTLIRIIIYSISIILILHLVLKQMIVQAEYFEDIQNMQNFNLKNNSDSEKNAPGYINTLDMKNDLLNFINEDAEIYNIDKKDNTENDNSFSNLSNFFEKKTVTVPEPVINLNTKPSIDSNENSNNQWSYSNENIINGGEITNGLFGYDNSDNWAQCDLK